MGIEEEQDALTSGPTRSERGIVGSQLSADGMKGEGRGVQLGQERKQAARRGEKSGEREFWAGEES